MRFAALLLLCALPALGQNKSVGPTSEMKLREAYDAGDRNIPLFESDPRPVNFVLSTSWISGEGHKGYFRYRLHIKGSEAGDGYKVLYQHDESWWSISETNKRISRCDFTLLIEDDGGFLISRIPITVHNNVDEQMKVASLMSNDMYQMDLGDYLSFTHAKPPSNWNIGFACK